MVPWTTRLLVGVWFLRGRCGCLGRSEIHVWKISQFFLELCLCVTASFQKTEQLQQKINNACCTRTNSTVVRTIANFFCFVSCLEKWGFTVPAVETLGVCRFLYARHRGGGSRVCDKRDCARVVVVINSRRIVALATLWQAPCPSSKRVLLLAPVPSWSLVVGTPRSTCCQNPVPNRLG